MGFKKLLDSQTIFIKSCELSPDLPNTFQIRLQKGKFQLIKGSVYSTDNKPSAGTVIEVSQIDRHCNTKNVLGYAITDEFGDYAFTIKANPHDFYELAVYMPLIT